MSMPETFNNMFQNPADIILFVLAILVLLIFCGCIYAFFRAVFHFIGSEGKDEKVKTAWNSVRYMVIGLFLTIVLLFAVPPLLKTFNLPKTEAYTTKAIFVKVGQVVNGIGEILGIIIKEYPNGTITPTDPLGSSESSSRDTSSSTYQL